MQMTPPPPPSPEVPVKRESMPGSLSIRTKTTWNLWGGDTDDRGSIGLDTDEAVEQFGYR